MFDLTNPWLVTIVGGLVVGIILLFFQLKLSKSKHIRAGQGGKGGSAQVRGKNSSALGGPGGSGGPWGQGGDGGNATAHGDNTFAMGGEGGEAGQLNRGGHGGRSAFEILGRGEEQLPDGTYLREYGRGGKGAGPVNNRSTYKKNEN